MRPPFAFRPPRPSQVPQVEHSNPAPPTLLLSWPPCQAQGEAWDESQTGQEVVGRHTEALHLPLE